MDETQNEVKSVRSATDAEVLLHNALQNKWEVLLHNALQNKWPFVLCVKTPTARGTVTNLSEKEEAQMLAKFARRAKKRLQASEGL